MGRSLSVIIPCYNYAHLLKECVDSVRAQTLKPNEIIVVDDESPDNTKEVCIELGVACVSRKNGGLSAARNTGIEFATSEFIMCLDADDTLPPRSLEMHMAMADDKVIAQCGLQEFGERSNRYIPRGADLRSIWRSNSIYCNAVFPKAVWAEVGGFDESETMRLGYEDWEFWIRCIKAGCRVRTNPEVGLNYRYHHTSMTRTTTHSHSGELTQYIQSKHADIRN